MGRKMRVLMSCGAIRLWWIRGRAWVGEGTCSIRPVCEQVAGKTKEERQIA